MKLWIGMALAVCTGLAIAGRDEVRKQAEASMLVTGTIDIDTDGRVGDYRLDKVEKLPEGVIRMIGKAASTWKFEPVVLDGRVVQARTKMSLRIVARRQDEERFEVRIASANFGGAGDPGEFMTIRRVTQPEYPDWAVRNGVEGTVYLLFRVGRDGSVEDMIAEQVNLRVVDRDAGMMLWRETLSNAVMDEARRWKFNPPTIGEHANKPFWVARMPVDFVLDDEKTTSYGQWKAYIPGPRQSAPWQGEFDTSLGADAVAAGNLYPIGAGPKLLTPLNGA